MNYRKIIYREYTTLVYHPMIDLSKEAYRLRAKAFRQRFSNILPTDKDAAILDIGCGVGFFLWFLQKNGFTNTSGIDVSPEQVKVADKFGVKGLHLCNWKEYLAEKSSYFDFILLDNVLEHLTKDEIVEILSMIQSSLKVSGYLYVSTPNVGSLFGIPLAFIDFTHEVYFTIRSLQQILIACGFNHIDIFGEPLISYDFFSFLRKTAFMIIKPFIKALYIVGTGGGGRAHIPHCIEPIIAAIAKKSL